MSGRIRDDDIGLVRERSPIAAVVGDYLQLRSAGGAELKGLCPFHEEKTPSFHVSPQSNLYYCFGCGQGGDVIAFLRRLEHLSFTEAVEKLASRAGVELHYEGGTAAARSGAGQRGRLIEAHRAAVAHYAERLASDPAAADARRYLAERGFDHAAATAYAVGYSADSWDALTRHLTAAGFTREELLAAGLVTQGQRGLVDRFRGRLMFPIADITGDVVGFGARKLGERDTGPKYLNSPETSIYKKSHVLYGLDKAKQEIARRYQAVVVEGYTDVMACHLAGVGTAVATCGTSFGTEHIQLLRRLLMDQDEFRGEVVFTFDGDAAGQRAALRTFAEDQRFVTQTFVAVEPSGVDPCELRRTKGDAAVRDLVARRVPLFEFYLRSVLARHDLDLPEGRVQALHAAAPVVASIRDASLRPEYARRLAGWLGMEIDVVVRRVAEAGGSGTAPAPRRATPPAAVPGQAALPGTALPNPADPRLAAEREVLKAALQHPALAGPVWDTLDRQLFTEAAYRSARDAVAAAGGVSSAEGAAGAFVSRVLEAAADDGVRALLTQLAVEPLRSTELSLPGYVAGQIARLQELGLTRRIQESKSRLQRLNPVEQPEQYNRLFGELISLEARKRALREQAIGELGA